MRQRRSLFLLMAGGLTAAGCSDQATEPFRPAPDAAVVAVPPATPDDRPDEAEMRRFAQRVPGLGGYHFDPDGALVVSLADPEQERAARAALAGVAARGSGGIRFRPARYTFAELRAWRDAWSDRILEVAGVTFVDLDEAENRVTVGVAEAGARARVAELLRDSEVPLAAVGFRAAGYVRSTGGVVEYAPYVSSAPMQGDSITSYRRPLEGGLKITYRHSSDPDRTTACTAGFIAVLNGVRVMITASHCSRAHWDLDNTSYFQARQGAGRYFGYEYRDPNGKSCGLMSPNVCRNADVSAIAIESDVLSSLGYIVRPLGPPPDSISPYIIKVSSLLVDPQNQRFQIVAVREPAYGERVDKVGATTGWTRGPITGTCVDMPADRSWSKLRCQTWAMYSSTDGDSGGPVFIPGAEGTATLLGMNWGIVTRDGVQHAVFSSVGQIEKDLGSLQVMPGSSSGGGDPGGGGGDGGGLLCPPDCVT